MEQFQSLMAGSLAAAVLASVSLALTRELPCAGQFAGQGEEAIQLTVNGELASGQTANPVTLNIQ